MIPYFHGILTVKYIYGIMCMIQGEIQGQKVNFKVKFLKKKYFRQIKIVASTSFCSDFE